MRTLLLLLALALPGCGPILTPMIPRLTEEQQSQVDQMWQNLLTPPTRVSHETLLDVLMNHMLYSFGTDRATYRAEKVVRNHLVLMEITFDRHRPNFDRFTVAVHGPDGSLLRQDHYSRQDIENLQHQWRRSSDLSAKRHAAETRPADPTAPPLTPAESDELQRFEARAAAAAAATQPPSP